MPWYVLSVHKTLRAMTAVEEDPIVTRSPRLRVSMCQRSRIPVLGSPHRVSGSRMPQLGRFLSTSSEQCRHTQELYAPFRLPWTMGVGYAAGILR